MEFVQAKYLSQLNYLIQNWEEGHLQTVFTLLPI